MPGWAGRARVERALSGGITNRNYVIDVDGELFVLRVAGHDTHLLEIDRHVEHEAASRAASLGIGPRVAAFLEPEGYLVTAFVAGRPIPAAELASPACITAVSTLLRAFHGSGPLGGEFDCFRVPHLHRAAAAARGVEIPPAFEPAAARAREIEAAFRASPEAPRACHNDLLNANFLSDDEQVWLLDWEYAGNNDRYFDLGNLAVNNGFDTDAEDALLVAYFGAVTARRRARLRLMRIMSDFREAMWGVVQQGISRLDFDYVAYADEHLDRMLTAAAAPGFPALLAAAVLAPEPTDA